MNDNVYAHRLSASVEQLRAANLGQVDPIEVAKLRKQFDAIISEMVRDTSLSDVVQPKVLEVKKAVSFHQLLWGTCRMLKDPRAYRRDAQKVGHLVASLIEDLQSETIAVDPIQV